MKLITALTFSAVFYKSPSYGLVHLSSKASSSSLFRTHQSNRASLLLNDAAKSPSPAQIEYERTRQENIERAIRNREKRSPKIEKKREQLFNYKKAMHKKQKQQASVERSIFIKPNDKCEITIKSLEFGQKHSGVVVKAERHGLFVDIGARKPGFIHCRDIREEFVPEATDLYAVGDDIDVFIKYVDAPNQKFGLSCLKPLRGGLIPPQNRIKLSDLDEGDELWGEVTKVTPYGAYIDVGAEVDAFLHVTECAERPLVTPDHLRLNKHGEAIRTRPKFNYGIEKHQFHLYDLEGGVPAPANRFISRGDRLRLYVKSTWGADRGAAEDEFFAASKLAFEFENEDENEDEEEEEEEEEEGDESALSAHANPLTGDMNEDDFDGEDIKGWVDGKYSTSSSTSSKSKSKSTSSSSSSALEGLPPTVQAMLRADIEADLLKEKDAAAAMGRDFFQMGGLELVGEEEEEEEASATIAGAGIDGVDFTLEEYEEEEEEEETEGEQKNDSDIISGSGRGGSSGVDMLGLDTELEETPIASTTTASQSQGQKKAKAKARKTRKEKVRGANKGKRLSVTTFRPTWLPNVSD